MQYNKLVRDNIPDILEAKEISFTVDTMDKEAFELALRDKLVEEANEFRESGNIEDIADIFEIIDAIIAHKNWTELEVRKIQKDKANKRGRFKKRILLVETKD